MQHNSISVHLYWHECKTTTLPELQINWLASAGGKPTKPTFLKFKERELFPLDTDPFHNKTRFSGVFDLWLWGKTAFFRPEFSRRGDEEHKHLMRAASFHAVVMATEERRSSPLPCVAFSTCSIQVCGGVSAAHRVPSTNQSRPSSDIWLIDCGTSAVQVLVSVMRGFTVVTERRTDLSTQSSINPTSRPVAAPLLLPVQS